MWSTIVNVVQGIAVVKTVKDWLVPGGAAPAQPQVQVRASAPPPRRPAPRSGFDPDRYTFLDARGLRSFYPSNRMELTKRLRLLRVSTRDATGHLALVTFDPLVPIEASAIAWVAALNERLTILASIYALSPTSTAQVYLRAVLPSQARMFAKGGEATPPFAVLLDVGEAARFGLERPVATPKVETPAASPAASTSEPEMAGEPSQVIPAVVAPWAPAVAAPETVVAPSGSPNEQEVAVMLEQLAVLQRAMAEAEVRRAESAAIQAEEAARREAEAQAKAQAEDDARRAAEAQAQAQVDDDARREAEAAAASDPPAPVPEKRRAARKSRTSRTTKSKRAARKPRVTKDDDKDEPAPVAAE